MTSSQFRDTSLAGPTALFSYEQTPFGGGQPEITLTNVKRSGDRKKMICVRNAMEKVNPNPFRTPDIFSIYADTMFF